MFINRLGIVRLMVFSFLVGGLVVQPVFAAEEESEESPVPAVDASATYGLLGKILGMVGEHINILTSLGDVVTIQVTQETQVSEKVKPGDNILVTLMPNGKALIISKMS